MTIIKKMGISVSTLLLLVSCVTINIYFPAAAAEKAADKIIEDIWGTGGVTPPQPTTPPPEGEQQSQLNTHIAIVVLNWLVPAAEAAEPNLNVNSTAINTIRNRMKQRHSSLEPFFNQGAVGLTEQGLLAIRDMSAVALKDRNTVKALVTADNQDRQAMYAEIARANGHPEWQAQIQATFSERWVKKAAKGWWYQVDGSWKRK